MGACLKLISQNKDLFLFDKNKMNDPRFTTAYSDNYKGQFFFRQNQFLVPASVNEVWIEPGYNKVRKDKGFDVTVNDYSPDRLNYGGNWQWAVHTPFKTPN